MGARRVRLRAVGGVAAALLVAGSLGACKVSDPVEPEQAVGGPFGMYVVPPGIHKIKHVIIVMQENRSFDSYFGTYPGADGIPMRGGIPAVCVPVPSGGCRVPYHDRADVNGGGPHAEANAIADVDGGRMDGFIRERRVARTSCHIVADSTSASDRARRCCCPPTRPPTRRRSLCISAASRPAWGALSRRPGGDTGPAPGSR